MLEPTKRRPARRLRGMSVRLQLTLSYAVFTVIVAVALLAVGGLLLRFVPDGYAQSMNGGFTPNRSDLFKVFLKYTSWALGLLAVIGLGGGWLLAGTMLRPLNRITATARLARDGKHDERVNMPGRASELAELADTFDDMLDQMQTLIDEQRRFAANASHEIRTPLAATRTMLEIARADPAGRDAEQLLRRLQQLNERSIALTEALLTLAAVEQQELDVEVTDLALLATAAANASHAEAQRANVTISVRGGAAPANVDPTLMSQLVTNLVQNAIVHNSDGGSVAISTSVTAGESSRLVVSNTGEELDQATLARLTQPFARGAGRVRRGSDRHVGSGLGLAIVATIARAHEATLELTAREDGGLVVTVTCARSYD